MYPYLTTTPTARLVALVAILGAAPASAQLSLRDAFRDADRAAYGNRIAAGTSAAAHAAARAPLKGILPSVRIEAGYLRTTDPIGVFGSSLRQRTVTQANFDPQRLNYPSPIGNYQGGLVLEQPLVNADAWTGRRAAVSAADATRATEEWTRLSTHVDVVRAYYGAVLASERTATLQAAARAAHSHVAQTEAMVRQGLATKSDALLAGVRAGDVDAQLAEAEGAATVARRQLAVLLGRAGTDSFPDLVAPARLPSSARINAAVVGDTAILPSHPRADLRAATGAVEAAHADAVRARSTLLPRVNGFARVDWNSASRLYAGDRNWTVGVMASWNLLPGPGELADIQATAGRVAAARAQAEAARANARLEDEQTRIALIVALTRLDIAERGTAQSAEAHRMISRKYEAGLATVVELLDAQAAETQCALGLSQARWAAIVADAERQRALGLDPATLADLDDAATAAGRETRSGR